MLGKCCSLQWSPRIVHYQANRVWGTERIELHMGARRVGLRESSILPGRALPLMALGLDYDSAAGMSHREVEEP